MAGSRTRFAALDKDEKVDRFRNEANERKALTSKLSTRDAAIARHKDTIRALQVGIEALKVEVRAGEKTARGCQPYSFFVEAAAACEAA